ncbi:MAG: pyridoxamine 5'-phosphate oxidase family protein [Gracilibacteraceae bacterium]|jgi:nitroimidazol reductase NimA-like FMN-containing flavoprotein (pyridoxamine 5'-phosphate oxidase superfamily)|nr:pyridoxamine 5'-phosphate oxidase family protein [Gracilibacteraceae bacterium]
MRRSDREVKDRAEILDILSKCDVLRLGINTPDFPYVVPMNFGAEAEGEALTLWLHSASAGSKLGLLGEDSRAGFEADCSHKLVAGARACNYTMEYESVVGGGDIRVCGDSGEKRRGLKAIMRHYAPDGDFDFTDAELAGVCVLRLDVARITGKRFHK